MATLRSNSFTSYDLSEDEILQGCLLNEYQRMYYQTEFAKISEQILGLKIGNSKEQKEQNIMEYIQEHAYLQGQKEMLQTILDASIAAYTTYASKQNS